MDHHAFPCALTGQLMQKLGECWLFQQANTKPPGSLVGLPDIASRPRFSTTSIVYHLNQPLKQAPHLRFRNGFSIIEVMIAITVLAVALAAILNNYQVLDSARRDTAARGAVSEIARAILDRVVASDVRALGTANPTAAVVPQPWSLARVEDLPAVRPPLSIQAANPNDDLVVQGLLPANVIVPNLRVYIEYYRGDDVIDAQTGTVIAQGAIDDTAFDAVGKFRDAFRIPAWRTARRLATDQAPYLQIAEDSPMVIRIILVWDFNQRLEFYTTKRRSSGA